MTLHLCLTPIQAGGASGRYIYFIQAFTSGPSELQNLDERPLIYPVPLKFGVAWSLSAPGESVGARVKFPSGLYGNITTFGEAGL